MNTTKSMRTLTVVALLHLGLLVGTFPEDPKKKKERENAELEALEKLAKSQGTAGKHVISLYSLTQNCYNNAKVSKPDIQFGFLGTKQMDYTTGRVIDNTNPWRDTIESRSIFIDSMREHLEAIKPATYKKLPLELRGVVDKARQTVKEFDDSLVGRVYIPQPIEQKYVIYRQG